MNSAYGITTENLLAHLPAALAADPTMEALAKGVADILAARPAEIEAARIYTRIDSLPNDLLDILAYDFKIDWYNYDYPVEAKRNLIKTNYYVHRRLGTAGAVLSAIQSIYPQATVEEWWQDFYNGEPYHFRVLLEPTSPIMAVSTDEIITAIYRYKSLRSHLDGIYYRSTTRIVIRTSFHWQVYGGRVCGTYPVIARQGSLTPGTISTTASAQGVAYSVKRCGSQLNFY
jgi:phage tail P2-like protein